MDEQLEEPLEDKVYVLTMTKDEDGYDVCNKVFATWDAAVKAMVKWHAETMDYKLNIPNGYACDEEDFKDADNNWVAKDVGAAYLGVDGDFYYGWHIEEEVVRYE